MATSFVSYREKGYWIADDFVMLLARYLIEAYKRMPKGSHWKGKMKDDLFPSAMGGNSGGKSLYLDKYLDDSDKVEAFINWVTATQHLIKAKGKYISKDEINFFDHYEDGFVPEEKDLETKILIDLFDDVINIVKGSSGEDATSKAVLPFYRNPV